MVSKFYSLHTHVGMNVCLCTLLMIYNITILYMTIYYMLHIHYYKYKQYALYTDKSVIYNIITLLK